MQRRRIHTLERIEARAMLAADIPVPLAGTPAAYAYDGSGNNLTHLDWGSAGEALLRTAPAEYADGRSAPAGGDRPSARAISNALADQGDDDIISDRELSAMIYAWGQFIDHDLDLTPNGAPAERFDIAVPTGDAAFDPAGTGTQVIRLVRSAFDPATGVTGPREQINAVTAWLDGSMIYGSDAVTAAKLRSFVGGRLKTSAGNLLPLNDAQTFPTGPLNMANDAHRVANDRLFAAGDVRANENVELTALHTLFLREHNYWAGRIARAYPALTDEQLYQRARSVVIGEVQAITYNQWLPALLGRGVLERYTGYRAGTNPQIANEFSTAAFRLGHSLLGNDVEFFDDRGLEVGEELPLAEAFFNPAPVHEFGIGPILKYLASDPASELDNLVVDGVRNFLFGPPGAGGLDLASLNIQRGRDHGLADYNAVRTAYGLAPVTDFAQITADRALAAELQHLYRSADNVDVWVGLLAEDHVSGSTVGPTLRAIVADQFERLRDGDRLWYQRTFSGAALALLENTTLTDVIRRNTEITNLQADAFYFRAKIAGAIYVDLNGDGRAGRGERGVAGVTVELIDAAGQVVATTTTDRRGQYSFDVASGVRTGQYRVRTVPPAGSSQPAVTSRPVAVTRGGQLVAGLNLGIRPSGAAGSTQCDTGSTAV